ncbi:hypothetical protein [Nostoc sp. 'Peltigera membranacea cyanobiont' 213]|nr:hypothetical protein [Nostoc sp. 'Peltigera membranacea cyanobiont' 213]
MKHETLANSLLESLYGRDCFTALFHETVSTVSSMFQRRET